MSNKSVKNAKDFLVSTADFAAYYNGVLACTGTTNLNTSIEVSMQEQNVNAGKGNQLIYSYKYGRELAVNLEAANWDIRFIAMQTGSQITEGLDDVYKLAECVQVTNGIGVLKSLPIDDVAVELSNGLIITVTPESTTIDLTKYGIENEVVKATYRYNRIAKSITIDSESSPFVYELVLSADKHNNRLGKVGTVQVIIPSYQPSGNFTMSFTPDGVSSTTIEGKALSVEGDSCTDGSAVYAYVKEFDEKEKAMEITEIAATPATISLKTDDENNKTATISVIGLKGALYSPIQLDNTDCEFVIDAPEKATVDTQGVVTAVAAGSAKVTVTYGGVSDEIDVVIE
ncbi:Ig-like domain-containing protein [Acetatifactor muris]|uniref:Bacterial Ig-like domain (Group 2) n=1 Tax=Acetatifactor muris TaxID=879566 RepID=A0A2K4ZP03_9FIRM|nr:Ig-like domain-containing protein [Acetatifactor muris]MCR2050667.1 Ig-like domain-containing protein [Acetatifactor muris]SOY32214.1 Bacterial Ig-like domain (group 2) [Acetatifactor muris]